MSTNRPRMMNRSGVYNGGSSPGKSSPEGNQFSSQQACIPDSGGVIDDTSPNPKTCIHYQGQWISENPNINQGQNGSPLTIHTTHWTTSKGSTASLMFNGIGVSVNAVYPVATSLPLAQVSFQVDLTTPTIVSAFNGTGTDPHMPTMQTMFASPALSPGNHTLTVQLLNSGNFTLNFFSVFGGSPNNSSMSDLPDSTPPEGQNNGSGRVIGGVFGGVIAVLLCIALVLFLRGRNRRSERSNARTSFYPPSTYYAPSTYKACRCSRHESVAVPPSTYLGSEQLYIDMQYSPRSTNFSFPQFASNPSDSGKRPPLPEKIPSVMA